MRISAFLSESSILLHLASSHVEGVLRELAGALARAAPNLQEESIYAVLLERERAAPTAMEKGVAIPHGRLAGVSSMVAAFGVSPGGVNFNARDGASSNFFFALLAPENSAGTHLKALAKVSRILRSDALRAGILACTSPKQAYDLLVQEDERTPI